MANTKKLLSFALMVILAASTLIAIQPAACTTQIPKPQVPQFTVQIVDASYDVVPTTTTNPFTGETSTTQGFHVVQSEIEIRIQNEPFTPFTAENSDDVVDYFYNILWKGHFEQDWQNMFPIACTGFLHRSDGAYTVYNPDPSFTELRGLFLENGSMIDFKVQAMIGYTVDTGPLNTPREVFLGELSEWSNIQTLTIGDDQPVWEIQPSPTPSETDFSATSTPSTPLQSDDSNDESLTVLGGESTEVTIAVLLVIVAVLLVSIIVLLRKRKEPAAFPPPP
jgi:hypothetical protein